MKKGWLTTQLGEIAKTQYGLSVPMNRNRKGFKIFRMGEVQDGRLLDTGEMKYADIGAEEFEQYKLHTGDVLFNRTNSFELVGKTGIFVLEGNYCFASYLVRLNLDRKKVLPEFLNYFMNSEHFQKSVKGKASKSINQANINATILSNELISFPELLSEQRRIAGILDEAFEGIATAKANAEKNRQNARALFESHLQSVFTQRGKGWTEKPLGSLASFRNGINYTKDSKGERIKILGVRNFQNLFLAPLDDLDMVTIDGQLDELDSLKQDDILAVRSNGNIELIGRCILVGEVPGKFSHSGFTIRIRLMSDQVLPRYLCHFMKSAGTRKRLTDGGTGTNIKSLNQGMLSSLTIPFPPISVQKALVKKLESLSEETQRLESIYERKVAALDALKKSLLHQAFSGQL